MKRVPFNKRSSIAIIAAGLFGCNEPETASPSPGGPGGSPETVIHKVSGDQQIARVGEELPQSLTIRVTSKTGIAVGGAIVTWFSSVPHAVLSPASGVTNAFGIATSTWTLGERAGPQVAYAESPHSLNPIQFTATALTGTATDVVIVSGDAQSGVAGTPLPDSLVVRVTDEFGNPVPGVAVMWTAAGDSGSVGPSQGVTSADGLAKTRWTLGPAVPLQAVRASAAGAIVQRFTASVQPGGQ